MCPVSRVHPLPPSCIGDSFILGGPTKAYIFRVHHNAHGSLWREKTFDPHNVVGDAWRAPRRHAGQMLPGELNLPSLGNKEMQAQEGEHKYNDDAVCPEATGKGWPDALPRGEWGGRGGQMLRPPPPPNMPERTRNPSLGLGAAGSPNSDCHTAGVAPFGTRWCDGSGRSPTGAPQERMRSTSKGLVGTKHWHPDSEQVGVCKDLAVNHTQSQGFTATEGGRGRVSGPPPRPPNRGDEVGGTCPLPGAFAGGQGKFYGSKWK